MKDYVVVYQDRADKWRWQRRHPNGNIVSDSGQGYTRKWYAKLRARVLNPFCPVETWV